MQCINNKLKGRKLTFFYVHWLLLLIYSRAYLLFQHFTALIDFLNGTESQDDRGLVSQTVTIIFV